MTLKRMDNILIVVDDLEAVKAFFVELGLKLEGQTTVEGPAVGSPSGWEMSGPPSPCCERPMGRESNWTSSTRRMRSGSGP
ncbi:hypothetical protein GmRootV118_38280 [Variovorax sp. V118]